MNNVNLERNDENTSNQVSLAKALALIDYAKSRVAQGKCLPPGTYARYMNYLRNKPLVEGNTERHHVIPKHQNGSDKPDNLIRIAVRDHILAHLLLYLEQGQPGDIQAYTLRKCSQHVDLREQGKKIAFLNKMANRGRFNSDTQRELGLRGGKIGGSRNTEAQRAARSAVGKQFGEMVGLTRQSDQLKDELGKILVFSHKNLPNEFFFVADQKSATEIAGFLNQECDNRNCDASVKLDIAKVNKGGVFFRLIRGVSPTAYGWKIVQRFDESLMDD